MNITELHYYTNGLTALDNCEGMDSTGEYLQVMTALRDEISKRMAVAAAGERGEAEPYKPVKGLMLQIGKRQFPASDLAEASRIYQRERDASGEGGSTFHQGHINVIGGTFKVSYNGRVWFCLGGTEALILEAQ